MSLKPVTYYTIICDECGVDYFEGSDFSAWSDETGAREMFSDDSSDWSVSSDGMRHRCSEHNPFCVRCDSDAGPLSGERDFMCPSCWRIVGEVGYAENPLGGSWA